MRRIGFRAVVVSAAAALVWTTGTGAAQACTDLGITAGPSPAGPGDQVTWTIGGIEEGAGYVVTVAGREVGGGTAGTSPPTGSFAMSDFGQTARTVYVAAHVTHNHEGGPWGLSTPVQYRPPTTPAAPTAPPQTTTPRQDSPPPIGEEPQRDRRAAHDRGVDNRRPSAPDPKQGAGLRPVQQFERAPVRQRQEAPVQRAKQVPPPQVTSANTATKQVVVEQPARVGVGETASVASERRQDPSERRQAPREVSLSRTSPSPHPERVTDAVLLAQPERRMVEGGAAIPGTVLVALSALLVVGLAAAAVLALRGRGSPPAKRLAAGGPHWLPPGIGLEARSRDLLLEAELQELIAEERARQMTREAATRPCPG